ncbi:MAG: DUF3842 family protein [Acutalibacteraceae bacterium]|nr:DUF3842 family protein [Clostridiales bacterium]
MKIVVIDGQGGGIGKSLIEQIKLKISNAEVIAIGTNSVATSCMLKAGATYAATGENSVVVACKTADIIAGPIGIVLTDSMLGEITQKMTHAVTTSNARKVLIPISKCHTSVAGLVEKPMSKYIDDAIDIIKSFYD